jgi:hypothetical protein
MQQANKDFLDATRHHYLTLVNAGYLRGLNVHEKEGLIRVAREEFFGAGYSPDMFCPSCVAEMVKSVYRAYDNWLKNNA